MASGSWITLIIDLRILLQMLSTPAVHELFIFITIFFSSSLSVGLRKREFRWSALRYCLNMALCGWLIFFPIERKWSLNLLASSSLLVTSQVVPSFTHFLSCHCITQYFGLCCLIDLNTALLQYSDILTVGLIRKYLRSKIWSDLILSLCLSVMLMMCV